MNNAIEHGRWGENRIESLFVDQVDLMKDDGSAGYLLDTLQGYSAWIGKIVDNGNIMSFFQQFKAGVAADITGPAGNKNIHFSPGIVIAPDFVEY